MGMYTEFVFAAELSKHTPLNVLDILKYLTCDQDSKDIENIEIPDHPFFKTERWKVMASGASAYFPGETHSSLLFNIHYYCLTIRSTIKDYDSEFELFLEWISPHIITHGFLGYMRCEEFNDPTLIYCDAYGHKIYSKKVDDEEVYIYG